MRVVIAALFVAFGCIAERAVQSERRRKEGDQRINRLIRFLEHVMKRVRHHSEHRSSAPVQWPQVPGAAPPVPGAATGRRSGDALRIEDLALSADDVLMLTGFLQELSSFLDIRFKELHALLELMQEINMQVMFDEVLAKAYETLRIVFPYNRLGVAMIDADGKIAHSRWAQADYPEKMLSVGYSAPLEGSSLQAIISTGEARIINDLPAYLEAHPQSAATRLIVGEGIRSSLTCPLIATGRLIGFMFFSSRTPNTYKDAHIEIFKLIAGHIAVVMEKGNLYQQILEEKEKSDRLLLNVVPARIAARLRAGEQSIVEYFPEINILFADIVAFTEFASRYSPERVVEFLQNIFVEFDRLCDEYGVEKIKTIGDEYMVISGPSKSADDKHLRNLAQFALRLQESVEGLHYPDGEPVRMRVGMHTGRAVAGVIGQKKFSYDIWGDAVNIASRMQSCGEPGRVLVTEEIRARLHSEFVFEKRDIIDVKGKGPMKTYFLHEKTIATALPVSRPVIEIGALH
jgi:class 3 adenylate cyclase